MKRGIFTAIALGALMTAAATAGASAHARYDFDQRITYLAQKIETGRRIGSITYTEGLRLRRLVRDLRDLLRSYEADGKLTTHERQTLRREADAVYERIQAERNDRQRRPGFLPRIGA